MAASTTKTGNVYSSIWAGAVTANGSGIAIIAFPAGLFKSAPIVVATGITDSSGRDMAVSIVPNSLTATGVQLQVRKSQVISVANGILDPFVPAAGALAHVIARVAS